MKINHTCLYCGTRTTINNGNYELVESNLQLNNNTGFRNASLLWIVCPNDECAQLSLIVDVSELKMSQSRGLKYWEVGDLINQYVLFPEIKGRVFPDYIPKWLLQDYEEAFAIRNLSPKASATLSRRCLEAMIADFWSIKKGSLFLAIKELEGKIDPLVWQSIDSVRKVGNIGAHMEKDTNVILDVEPNEAELLIGLIELLLEEWYIHRFEREQKLKAIVNLAVTKDAIKRGGTSEE